MVDGSDTLDNRTSAETTADFYVKVTKRALNNSVGDENLSES